jgi:hypothetical protein
LETVCDDLQNEGMDAGFDAEGDETKEDGWIGGGSGERVITTDGGVTSSAGVDLDKSTVSTKRMKNEESGGVRGT